MSDAVIAALSALGTGLLSLIGVYFANCKSSALIAYRLEQLEKKVDKHNKVVERTYILEGQVTELQHDVRDLKGAK
ncbi:MAG: hypothetical protein IJ523_06625 [Succinivibrionaceae bacterium]|nr:hypothetical protein [Succinivibrionaceae bacterium]